MLTELPDWIGLKLVDLKISNRDDESPFGPQHPRVVIETSAVATFHFPFQNAFALRHVVEHMQPVPFSDGSLSFQWIGRNMSSKWIADPARPGKTILVGVIDAIVLEPQVMEAAA